MQKATMRGLSALVPCSYKSGYWLSRNYPVLMKEILKYNICAWNITVYYECVKYHIKSLFHITWKVLKN